MTLRVYVAGSSKERERVRAAMDAVRAIEGCELAHDWLAHVEETIAAGKTDADLSDRERDAAEADLRAVRSSDLLWFLVPESHSDGAHVELGYAIGLGTAMGIVASGEARGSIFVELVDSRFKHDRNARTHIEILARVR